MSSFFSYSLPEERIALRPLEIRDRSKLLHVKRKALDIEIEDKVFSDIESILVAGDLLVVNNSKVLPTRFFPKIAEVSRELFLVIPVQRSSVDSELWEALAKPMREFAEGLCIELGQGLRAQILGRTDCGKRLRVLLESTTAGVSVESLMLEYGTMPIPPYIRSGRGDESDKSEYQTTFAEISGSVAAPTAGLHLTPELIARLSSKGVNVQFVTLHVGPASFIPVSAEDWAGHPMPREHYRVPVETLRLIRKTKQDGGRIWAVGTTSVRALESLQLARNFLDRTENDLGDEDWFETELMIRPGFRFEVVDGIITNFHQPRSTHLLLVAAFLGEGNTERAYQHALQSEYRFLSYGDAMCLERENGVGNGNR